MPTYSRKPCRVECQLLRKTNNSIYIKTRYGEKIWFPLALVISQSFLYDHGSIEVEEWIARKKGVY